MTRYLPPPPPFVVPLVGFIGCIVLAVAASPTVALAWSLGVLLRPLVVTLHEHAVESNPESSYARALRALGRGRG